jgi:hypothetical protein
MLSIIFATGIQIVHQEAQKPSAFLEISVGVAVVVITSIFGYLVKKFNEDREDRQRSEDKIDRVYNALITADADELNRNPPLGLIDQTAAAVAVANEALVATKEATAETRENSAAVFAMSGRFREQNGTVLDIQTDIGKLHTELGLVKTAVERIEGKPPASVADVVAAVAHEHEAQEERQSALLGAIQSDTSNLVTSGESRDAVLEGIATEQERVKDEKTTNDEAPT